MTDVRGKKIINFCFRLVSSRVKSHIFNQKEKQINSLLSVRKGLFTTARNSDVGFIVKVFIKIISEYIIKQYKFRCEWCEVNIFFFLKVVLYVPENLDRRSNCLDGLDCGRPTLSYTSKSLCLLRIRYSH